MLGTVDPSPPVAPAQSLWRPGPRRLARLVLGLWIFGTGEALVVLAALGNSPWTVFAEGVSGHTPLSIGSATIATSAVILLAWLALDVRPGLGTIANAILIGIAIDVTLSLLDEPSAPAVRAGAVLGGIALVGLGSGLYLGTRLGPGPRDGLMLGLHARTGRPVALLRTGIELSALVAGVLLGGRAGVGTLAFAVLVGPAVATGLRMLPGDPSRGRGERT
ncbi:MAG: rane protein [Solirubrobacterales bacterium]|nr:rane protein [Solirubrobacterales bacterium]